MPITLDGTNGITTNSGTVISASTIGVGGATPSTSGAGITFPATQSASSDANTLDDYEEGDWTPTYYGSSTVGTTTYTTQLGRYTKVGRAVTVSFQVAMSNATGTGDIRIGGFPFTSNSSIGFIGSLMTSNLNWGSGDFVTLFMGNNDAFARVYRVTNNAGTNETGIDTSCTIYGSFTYMT